MNNKFLTILFLSLFFVSLVSAVKPTQQGANVFLEGYDIEFTGIDIYENGENIYFTNHVFNISNGLELDVTEINCTFDLYDNKGFHLLNEVQMEWDVEGNDFEYIVLGGNFTRNGAYCHMIHCNSSAFGGFEESCFEVTPTGESGNMLGLYILLYAILFGIVIFGVSAKSEWIAIIGGLGLIFLGIYTLNTGIIIFRNVATEVIAWITIALGSIVSIVIGITLIEDNL